MQFLLLLLLAPLLRESFAQDNYINVVLFFANFNSNRVGSIAYLNVSKVTVVKPCVIEQPKRPSNNYRKIIHGTYMKKCNCQQILNESIFSMLNWGRSTLQMATAIITIKNYKNNNAVTYYSNIDDKKPNLLTLDPEKHDFGKVPLPPVHSQNSTKEDPSQLELEKTEDEDDDSIIMMKTFPHQKKYSQHYINLKRVQRTIGVSPINHKVIHINSNNIRHTSTLAPSWNMLGSISAIKDSYLINLVNSFWENNLEDDQHLDVSSLGKVQKRCLFHITEQVLSNIKSVEKKRGFLLVIYGGQLSMLDNPYSELVQSIKHVLETNENTLVVVTSNCPTDVSYSVRDHTMIPIYATGPFAWKLAKAKQLSDVCKIVRQILTEKNDVKNVTNVVRDEKRNGRCEEKIAKRL